MTFSFHATENLCVSGITNWESFNHYYKTRPLQTNPLKKRELQEPFPYSLTYITIHLTPAFPVALFLKQIDFVLAIFDQQGNFGLPLVQPLNNWEEILTEYSFVQMRSEKRLTSSSSWLPMISTTRYWATDPRGSRCQGQQLPTDLSMSSPHGLTFMATCAWLLGFPCGFQLVHQYQCFRRGSLWSSPTFLPDRHFPSSSYLCVRSNSYTKSLLPTILMAAMLPWLLLAAIETEYPFSSHYANKKPSFPWNKEMPYAN